MGVQVIPIPTYVVSQFPFSILCFIPIPMGFPVPLGIPFPCTSLEDSTRQMSAYCLAATHVRGQWSDHARHYPATKDSLEPVFSVLVFFIQYQDQDINPLDFVFRLWLVITARLTKCQCQPPALFETFVN